MRQTRPILLAASVAACAAFSALAWAQQAVELVVVDVATVAKGYRASASAGSRVSNEQGERVGKLNDLIVGQDRVLFAVVSVGGCLGDGEHKVAVPYQSLVLDGDRVVLPGATKEALKTLPTFEYPS